MNPGLGDRFAGAAGRPVVDNDANLAALAEGWRGAPSAASDYVALLSGERLGGGVVLGGTLLRGARGLTGEMRYLDLVEGVGSAEGVAALARSWAQRVARRSGSLPRRSSTPSSSPGAEQVLAAAAAGDPLAREVVDRLAARLTAVAATLANLLDVSLLVVGGALAASAGRCSPRCRSGSPPACTHRRRGSCPRPSATAPSRSERSELAWIASARIRSRCALSGGAAATAAAGV